MAWHHTMFPVRSGKEKSLTKSARTMIYMKEDVSALLPDKLLGKRSYIDQAWTSGRDLTIVIIDIRHGRLP